MKPKEITSKNIFEVFEDSIKAEDKIMLEIINGKRRNPFAIQLNPEMKKVFDKAVKKLKS